MSIRRFSRVAMSKDFHSVLGVKRGAENKEIRSAYLTLAKKYHPDAPTGNTEKFKQIAEAYENLNQPRAQEEKKAREKSQEPERKPSERQKENAKEYYEDMEEDWEGYEDWKSKKKWSHSNKAENFEAHGYEYYDPYVTNKKRYTYSQFKKDKYNHAYQKPERSKPSQSSPPPPSESSTSYMFPSLISLGLVASLINAMMSPSPEINSRGSKSR